MDIKEMEQYIKQIKAVESCKIILDQEQSIDEIHIVSGMSRSPKQISRDIQSILISKFGLSIDHKKISIAQINIDSIADGYRLKLKTIEYSITEGKANVRVALVKDEEIYDGVISGVNTTYNTQRMLAKATLLAVEKYCGVDDTLVLEDIKTSTIAGTEVAVVAVSLILPNHEQMLTGSALVSRDKKEAIVKATLDAVNRSIIKYNNNIQAG